MMGATVHPHPGLKLLDASRQGCCRVKRIRVVRDIHRENRHEAAMVLCVIVVDGGQAPVKAGTVLAWSAHRGFPRGAGCRQRAEVGPRRQLPVEKPEV